MIPARTFKDKKVALFGLGGSGLVTARALVAGGADIVCFDDSPAQVERAKAEGIPVADLRESDWSGFSVLVLAPGVPLTHPVPHWSVGRARAQGIPIIGDVEIFCRERASVAPDAPLVAITGTNGKSTTTALVAHLLAAAGRDVQMGGNIGVAILDLAPLQSGRTYVIECSSYQIDLAPSLKPTVGVLLNLSPDHLDRHGTMENYAAIKERLVAACGTAVVGVEDRLSAAIADRVEAAGTRVRRVSARFPVVDGVYAQGTRLFCAENGAQSPVAEIGGIDSLRGAHNAQNAAAAVAACLTLGISAERIAAGLRSFPGLAHRMQIVGRAGKVLFVNDSKATNADAAARALASFGRIYWIAGGKAKAGGITSLHEYFPRIAKAYLIGEAAAEFAATLGTAVAHEICGTLEAAVAAAARDAAADDHAEPVVLLSPACASFDQFANFEVRGEAFAASVRAIIPSASGREVA